MKVTSNKQLPLPPDVDIGGTFDIYKNEQVRLLNIAWKYDTIGNTCKAQKAYKAASIHTLLATYARILSNTCLSKEKVECVEKNLPCLSKEYETDYVRTWKKLKEYFNITTSCDECCVGIGKMIINKDGCDTFSIGPCN